MIDDDQPTIGAELRKRRQELGRALDELAEETKIRRTYLEAMEEDRFEKLPGEAYVAGFLRSYAQALGLPAEQLLRRRRPKPATDEPETNEPLRGERPPAARKLTLPTGRGRRSLRPAMLILLVTAVLTPLILHLARRQESKPLPPAAREEPVPAPAIPPAPASQPTPADVLPATAQTAAVETPPAPPGPAVSGPAIPGAGARLRLTAKGPARIELSVDGRPPRRYDLKAGSALSWPVTRSVRFVVDDPAAVHLWLGERELDLAGRGEIVLQQGEATRKEGSE